MGSNKPEQKHKSPQIAANRPQGMRRCGACKFREITAAPSSACVLAFSRTSMGGKDGILQHMAALAASKQVPGASSYCTRCRAFSWLCSEDSDLDQAALHFWHRWRDGERVASAMARCAKLLTTKGRKQASRG
jgi:hypothetical protein